MNTLNFGDVVALDSVRTDDLPSLGNSMLLVNIKGGKWSPNRQDKNASAKLAHDAGAQEGMVRAHKTLLKSTLLTHINSLYTRIFARNRELTVEWMGDVRGLPGELFPQWENEMSGLEKQYANLADEFTETDYAKARADAVGLLGTLHDNTDYPPLHVLRSKFYLQRTVMGLPEPDDIRVQLGDANRDAIIERYRKHYAANIEQATRSMHDRLYRALAGDPSDPKRKGLIELLEGTTDADGKHTKGKLSPSRLDGMRELLDLLGVLNIGNDPDLEQARQNLLNIFEGVRTTDDLKSQHERDSVKAELKKVMDNLPSLGW